MKTLRICLSDDLPIISERDPNYIYFLYDRLIIFDGQTQHYDQFCIVENLPGEDEIIPKMWYICFDGVIRCKYDYEIHEIATVEDQAQLELLLKAGTTYFYSAERRYLNPSKGIIELPYMNGTFLLSVHLASNIVLDKNTVIAFNPETSEFEIAGDTQQYDDIVFTHDFKGVETPTVKTTVEHNRIKTDVKVSNGFGNIIKSTGGGLYASVGDKVNYEAFERYKRDFSQYIQEMDFFVDDLKEEIRRAEEIISEDAIISRILVLLEARYPGVEEALAKYDEWAEKLDGLEDRIKNYTDTTFDDAESGIRQMIDDAMRELWTELGYDGEIDPPGPDPSPEPDNRIVVVDSIGELPELGKSTTVYLVKRPKVTESDREPQAYNMYYWKWTNINPAEYTQGEYVFYKVIQEYSEFFDYQGPITVEELPENPGYGAVYMIHFPVEYEGDVDHYDMYTWLGEDYVFLGSYTGIDTPHHTSKSTFIKVNKRSDLIDVDEHEDYLHYIVDDGNRTSIYVWMPGIVVKSTLVQVDRVEELPEIGSEYISYEVNDVSSTKIYSWFFGEKTNTTTVIATDKSKFPETGEYYVSYMVEKQFYQIIWKVHLKLNLKQ